MDGYKYPSRELMLPLWCFFRHQADGAFLADFLNIACTDYTLEEFLQASLAMPGVREHMEASAVILRGHGKTELAKSLEAALQKKLQ